ncbi:MAG: energy-coupling factor ABC transporter ATP-binding protein [Treponema sp.]|nr:energy-coupling factor ABC transporter ATP-binding protein [Treponema sp.]
MSNELVYQVRGLRKHFPPGLAGPQGLEALSALDLDIYRGECLLIAGANGSGKTLLMKILSGLEEPTGGEILFMGRPLGESEKQLRAQVGLIFQDPDTQILGETVEEDIRFGPENRGLPRDEIKRRVQETLDSLDLSAKGAFSSRRLSGGEKRRLAIGGILASGCEVLIMDEPFAHLDWPGVVQVLSIIRDLKGQGKTLIILTHELEKVLALADRLVILQGGRVRDQGSSDEVLDRLDPAWGVRDPRGSQKKAQDCTWL